MAGSGVVVIWRSQIALRNRLNVRVRAADIYELKTPSTFQYPQCCAKLYKARQSRSPLKIALPRWRRCSRRCSRCCSARHHESKNGTPPSSVDVLHADRRSESYTFSSRSLQKTNGTAPRDPATQRHSPDVPDIIILNDMLPERRPLESSAAPSC